MTHTENAVQRVAAVREHAEDIAQRMAHIKLATAEQGSATHEMARSAERVNVKTHETDTHLQDMLHIIHGLLESGEALKGLVARFRL